MIDIDLPNSVQWRVATRYHDWFKGDFLRLVLIAWEEHQLIGPPTQFEVGDADQPWHLKPGESLADALLRSRRNPAGGVSARMSGADPRPWGLSVVLSAFDSERNRTKGYSMINLNLPRRESEKSSGALLDLFEELHQPDRCEYASIHPRRHAEELRMRAYVPALTIAPMFAGMLWANFLGPRTVEEFPHEAIDALAVARRRWFNQSGVFLAVTDDLGSIDSSEGTAKLIALTEALRVVAQY